MSETSDNNQLEILESFKNIQIRNMPSEDDSLQPTGSQKIKSVFDDCGDSDNEKVLIMI